MKLARIVFFLLIPLLSYAMVRSSNRAPSPPFISGDGFKSRCDYVFDEENQLLDPLSIEDRSTIFVWTDLLGDFFAKIHPRIEVRYILVTHNSDTGAPGPFRPFLEDPKLLAWFAENAEGEPHPKLHPIPIGIANRCWPHGDAEIFQKKIETKFQKTHLLYLNLSIRNYYEERWQVYQLFSRAPYCYRPLKKNFGPYLEDLASCKFSLSPRGYGLDTYRLWESLYLGTFPIVKTSSLDPLYEKLPVVVVQDWTEVTEEFLMRKYEELIRQKFDRERLTLDYWMRKINAYKL